MISTKGESGGPKPFEGDAVETKARDYITLRNNVEGDLRLLLDMTRGGYDRIPGTDVPFKRIPVEKIGLFDEKHFAYLEDIDIGYRAQIHGYVNRYIPSAVVYHAGSGTSGSRHNAFKVRLSARNSVWLVRKNMPLWQVALNAPLLTAGWLIKYVYFIPKGLGGEFRKGLFEGLKALPETKSAPKGHTREYLKIQLQLWKNCFRRLYEGARAEG